MMFLMDVYDELNESEQEVIRNVLHEDIWMKDKSLRDLEISGI